ncbi:hypothetical protein FGO68_gene5771 [Halteria grandinella]|uniref:PAS domain-containing protein n=1 Tax=Halteria grandinella TaxID=5974 RepID=A0A8J8P6I8_HALGN|nr:hypothetical protein FGO68_gene5771 [Halteria grandinella]
MMDLALSTSQNLQTVSGGAINIVQEQSLSPEKPAGRRQFPEVFIQESNSKQMPIDRRGSIFRQPSYYPQPASASMTGQSLGFGSILQGGGIWENFNDNDYEMKRIDKYTMNQILRRRRSDFYQKLSSVDDSILENDKVLKNRYKQLTIIIKDAIEKYPTSIELRRINAFIQKAKLKNEFKAIFEMMNCELCNPSIYERFIIFREKIEVEQCLVMQHQKNILRVGTLDVTQVFNYEKLFQKYQLYEYLTAFAALQFWKELLEKNINAAVLQERGSDISKNYEIIQNISERLQEIYPNEIKFLYRYGIFLLKIIHNEYDSLECFRKAQTTYVGKDNKKGAQMPVNEQTIFGENTAAGIVVISATSSKIGTIIHCNEEVESVLGFQKRDIIGSNVTVLIPRPIAKVHDRLIQRYFETAKPTVIEIKRYLLANSRDGYLKEIELIVKVFPQVNEQIVFIGFISRHDRFDDMEQVKPEFEKLDKQYIITDVEGNITNITEGLKLDIGLHSKFFQYSDSMFQQMFNIQQICPEIFENDQNVQELIEGEGRQLAFDTRNILNNIELEQLNADDIEDIRENLGLYKVYVQLKKVAVSTYCQFHIYRIILLARYKDWDSLNQGHPISNYVLTSAEGETNQFGQQVRQLSLGSGGSNGHADNNSMSSVSSSQSQGFTFNRVIKDFKKALSERKTPQNLIMLNRIIILVLFIIVILSSVQYALLRDDTTKIESQNLDNLMSETRQLKLIQLSSNLRSYVNIANGLEFDRYEGTSLQAIDRFEYLGRLIQSQAVDLQEVHEYLTQRRGNGRKESSSSQISHFEYEKIKLFRLDENNQVTEFEQPFRVAFQIFLNQIQALNETDRSTLTLPNDLLEKPPINNYQLAFKQVTTYEQKAAYFLIINGLRSLRTKSAEATQLMRRTYEEDSSVMTFLTIMLIAIFMSCFAFGTVLYQVWVIERNKAKILSLYALLSMTEISQVYQACEQFMDRLNQGSVIMHLSFQRKCVKELEDCKLELAQLTSQLVKQDTAPQDYFISDDPQSTASLARHKKISIEPPEDRQKQKRLNDLKMHIVNLQSRKANFYGNEIYKEMINNTQEVMKVLVEAEEQEKENFKVMRITQKRMLVSNSKKIDQQKKVVKVKGTSNADLLQPTAIFAEQSRVKRIEKNVSESVKGGKAELIREHREKILNNQRQHNRNGHGHQGRQDESASSDNIKIPVKGKHQGKRLLDASKKSKSNDNARDSEDETNSRSDHTRYINESHAYLNDQHDEPNGYEENEHQIHHLSYEQEGVIKNEELEERKRYFFLTIKTQNWGKLGINLFVAALFIAYFVQVISYHTYFQNQLKQLQDEIPTLFNRFKLSKLSYSLIRERIIFNNSLSSFEDEHLDILLNEESIINERAINNLKSNHPSITTAIMELTQLTDTELFCYKIVGSVDATLAETVDKEILATSANVKPYQTQIETIVLAQRYALIGNITGLKMLQQKNVDLNSINYDKRTPLHFAAKGGQLETVKYLLSIGVSLNPEDRWKATPMNYARKSSQALLEFFITQKANEGPEQGEFLALSSVYKDNEPSDNELRAFYAAYFNDVQSMQNLKYQNILNIASFDKDGRSPLSVAASQGNLEAVKYLIANKANLSIRDARNTNSLQDAVREKRTDVVKYLEAAISETVIEGYCSDFADGILRKGLQQAVGSFHKRFADLQIKISAASSYQMLLNLLNPTSVTAAQIQILDPYYLVDSLMVYFSYQELYSSQVVERLVTTVKSTYTQHISDYDSVIQILFLIFLGVQIFTIMLFRGKLIDTMQEDIFQSRGILNLIPDSFFLKNKDKVEKIIRKLKD